MKLLRYEATVFVALKASLLDTQGKSVERCLQQRLGFKSVKGLRIGKRITFTLKAGNRKNAEAAVKKMCTKLLINPVIETYEFSIGRGVREKAKKKTKKGSKPRNRKRSRRHA